MLNICLLLMAGYGTRMGIKGKFLPKPLWPINQKRLIVLQIEYLHYLGFKEIWINLHHFQEMILNAIDQEIIDRYNVHFLIEDSLLDVGGGIQNWKFYNKDRDIIHLWVAAGDQILNLESNFIQAIKKKSLNEQHLLTAIQVESWSKHNQIVVNKNNEMVEIIKFQEGNMPKSYYTYSGLSRLYVPLLNSNIEKKNFFETIGFNKGNSIKIYDLGKRTYWDFGTLDRYEKNLMEFRPFFLNDD